jgi:hypothetical protein
MNQVMQSKMGPNLFSTLGPQLQANALANPVAYNTPYGTQPQQGFGWSTTPLPPPPPPTLGTPGSITYGEPGQGPTGNSAAVNAYVPYGGSNSFYPPPNPATQPKGYQSGAGDIGSVPPGQNWQPQSLSAGNLDLAKLKQLAQRQGLTPQQTNAIVSQMAALRAQPDAMSGAPGGASAWPEGTMSVAYQHGISDIGYPPMIGPGMEFHGDKGGWIGQMDQNYLVPRYWRGTGNVNPVMGAGALGLPGPVLGTIHRQRVGGVPMLRHTFPGTPHPTGMPPIGPPPRPSAGILPIKLG